jgi:hypothetical protein
MMRAKARARYDPKLPKSRPRALSDARWNDLFAASGSNRDRALVSLAVSCAARAA